MNFSSTPESADRSEITFLAIVETLVAVTLSIFLLKILGSATHIVIGALIAPFLFLRTDASTARAFAIFDSCFPRLGEVVSSIASFHDRLPPFLRSITFLLLWLPLFLLGTVAIRIAATILTLVSSPRESLLAIPGNWVRVALAMDHRHPPELLPGLETAHEPQASLENLKYGKLRSLIISATESALFQKLGVLAIYGSAVMYRFFLKSTSLIYFPLIWISDVPLTANGILNFPLERVRRWYAWAILVVMLSPLVISFHTPDTLATHRDRAIYSYVLPVSTYWWQISRVIAVGVTIAVYFYARTLATRQVQPETERTIIAGANRLRAACAVFTMLAFLIIVLTL